jgi:curved DNA-binding protein CbpA
VSNASAHLVPQLVSGIDIRRLPIGPEEAFVMSRIDGTSTSRDIEYATGLPAERVAHCLQTLEALGAIRYPNRPEPVRHVAPPAEVAPAPRLTPYPVAPSTGSTPSTATPPPHSAECGLDPERQHQVRELYGNLEEWDYYRILGVTKDADKKAIKDAYFLLVRVFHPDRYFGKNLGPLREMLEKCFANITIAYETLVNPSGRAEYDQYLAEKNQAYELEQSLKDPVSPEDLDALARRLSEAIPPSRSVYSDPALLSPPPPPTDCHVSAKSSSQPAPPSRHLSDDERRRVLAKKLRLSQPNLRLSSPPPPSPSGPTVLPKEQIADQLKRQYEQSRRAANQVQLGVLVAAADEAIERGDAVRAANSLRAAQSLAPKDPILAERVAQAQALASRALSDTYRRQGEYEEKSGRFEAAARSFERAANGKPEATTWESAARCILEAKGDLRMASDFVRRAMGLEPGRAASHILLGRIFMAARMRTSAQAELERARSLDPNDDTVTTLLKRLERESL